MTIFDWCIIGIVLWAFVSIIIALAFGGANDFRNSDEQ